MNDDINSKVISIFQRHRRGEHVNFDLEEEGGELILSPDGFNYLSLKHENKNTNEEASLHEIAAMKHYLVKMLEAHHESNTLRLNNYHIPGERLQDFLLTLSQRPGKVLEIKQFIPDTMA